jgi:hypothetical protein
MNTVMNVRYALFAFSILALIAPTGCGSRDPATAEISGVVTIDGAPVLDGDILFRAADGASGSHAGKIIDGKFSLESSPGAKLVEIRASREVPGKIDESNPGEPVPLREQFIPTQYNSQTTLTANVQAADDNTLNFDLKSSS